jgi:hypothetical protein
VCILGRRTAKERLKKHSLVADIEPSWFHGIGRRPIRRRVKATGPSKDQIAISMVMSCEAGTHKRI